MICTNCFKGEYVTIRIPKKVIINDRPVIIEDIECEKCASCGDIVFTHQQGLELDKKRINIEFSSKPILTPYQLALLRKILNMSLDEISDLLHIGKNTYGRWERGEVAITPSMNLLVHNFLDRFSQARVNLMEKEMKVAIEEAKKRYLDDFLSLGEFIRKVLSATKILPEVICRKIGIEMELFNQIQNNEVLPEKVPIEIWADVLMFFHLSIKNLWQLLENALAVYNLRDKVSFIHTRKANYGQKGVASQSRSINKILEQYLDQERSSLSKDTISEAYIKKIEANVKKKEKMEER